MKESISDAKIGEVSRDWAQYQRTEDVRYAWAIDEAVQWQACEDYDLLRRLVLAIAAQIDPTETYPVGMLGAGPVEDLVEMDPDTALDFLEEEIERSTTLREALTNVWSRKNPAVRSRIDHMLARYGKSGSPK